MIRRSAVAMILMALISLGCWPAHGAEVAKSPSAHSEQELRTLIDAGRYREAEAIIRNRLAAHRARDTAEAANDLELLANVMAFTGRSDEAETRMREALVVRERLGDPEPLATAVRRLALVLNEKTDYRAAEPLARRAIALAAPLTGKDRGHAAAWSALAQSLAGQRRRSEASAAFQRAIGIARTTLRDDDIFVVGLYNSLALNLEEMGELAEAEAIYRRGLATMVATKGASSLAAAQNLAMLSLNLDRQRRIDEAEAVLREAIAIREQVLGPNDPATLRSLGNLVGFLTRRFKLAEAEQLQARIIHARAALPDRNAADAVMDLGQMARILFDQGKPAEAIDHRRRALALAKTKLDPGHPFAAIAAIDLAMSLMLQDPKNPEYAAVMRDAVSAARGERARLLSPAGATGPSTADRALARVLSDTGKPDRSAANVFRHALSFNANYATQVRAEEAKLRGESFTIAQELAISTTARTLAGVAAREALEDRSIARFIRRREDLADQARAKNRALVEALARAPETAGMLRAELDGLGVRLAAADAALARAHPDYARLVLPHVLGEDEVRRRLERDEALLLIVEGTQFTLSFAVSKRGASWWGAPTVFGEAKAAIAILRCDVDVLTCPPDRAQSDLFDRVTAHELYRHLVGPHEATLQGVKTLYVATSGQLSELPFAALLTAAPTGPDTSESLIGAPWLGDRFALVSLPSVSSLRAVRAKRPKRGGAPFVGYGAPVLAGSGEKRAIPPGLAPGLSAEARLADPAKIAKLAPLPGTETELKAIAAVLGATPDAIRLGPNATEAAVRADSRLAGARVVVFATHGLLPGELDGFAEPGLVFTPPAVASARDDGVLSASEAAALTFDAEWMVLSACNTATADGRGGGDALSALGRAFLYAGADALLASRWRVGDDVTAALTVETLANARRNPRAGRAAALQAAMRAIRTGRRVDGSAVEGWTADWAHPASWAPFSVIAYSD